MIEYIKKECIEIDANLDDWKACISRAGELLEKQGLINHQYTLDMIASVEKNGPYIVVMPGVALAHARSNNNVNENSISIVVLKNKVPFGHSKNDPVKVVIAIAAINDEEHIELFKSVSNFLLHEENVERLFNIKDINELINRKTINLEKLRNGLIVSCYADSSINEYMDNSIAMQCVAKSCVAGGALGIRTNLEHVKSIREAVDVPLIGIKKIYKGQDELNSSFRITPTMREVESLVEAGVDGIAIDGTIRERYDDLTLSEFVTTIKKRYPDIFIVADISTLEEGIEADRIGVDAVGITLSGYTSYSKNPILFGTVPSPDPDYEIIEELSKAGVKNIIAEGRITDGLKLRKCFDAGAFSAVIGTSITEPGKIVKTILYDAQSK